MSKKKDLTFFSYDWLSDPEFKMWLVEVPGDNKLARCKHCKKSFNLSNMGRQALVSHGTGQKHRNIKSISVFTKQKHIKVNTNLSSMSYEVSNKYSIFAINSETVKAEIRWLLKSVISGYSNNSSANLNNLFLCMFPDSQLAKSFKLGPDKMLYSINFGVAPFFKSLLYEDIKKSCCFVACFDESLNPVTQTCEMDIVIRFFNGSKNLVESRYWNSKFLGHGTAADLERELEKCMEELDQSKMCQI